MELQDKLNILSAAAKYDVSCSSSGSKRQNTPGGIGNAATAGICHSWSEDGRCISLLKILFTNHCIYDCAYCANRRSNDIPRSAFTVDEVVDLTINFYRRNYIEGLFLSSGVIKDPDYTTEQLILVAKKLRQEYKYNGYIHLKIIPNANPELIREAGLYADRLSINIELPTAKSLLLLAPEKNEKQISGSIAKLSDQILENREERRATKKLPAFAPAGQSTQLIIGATPESDWQIIKLSENFYKNYKLKRVYYSEYSPINNDARLPASPLWGGTALVPLGQEKPEPVPPLVRENRLYQADWLLRFYKFQADEIVDQNNPFLDSQLDPKAAWALRHLEHFPVEINKAPYEMLLRVPGLGVRSAQRILSARRFGRLNFENLKKLGVVLKRAQFFITCNGLGRQKLFFNPVVLRQQLIGKYDPQPHQQLRLLAS